MHCHSAESQTPGARPSLEVLRRGRLLWQALLDPLQMWQWEQAAPSLQPFFLEAYLHAGPHENGCPTDPREGATSSCGCCAGRSWKPLGSRFSSPARSSRFADSLRVSSTKHPSSCVASERLDLVKTLSPTLSESLSTPQLVVESAFSSHKALVLSSTSKPETEPKSSTDSEQQRRRGASLRDLSSKKVPRTAK